MPESGYKATVTEGGDFRFRVQITDGYTISPGFAVRANGVDLAASGGIYTISNIHADQTISVSNVELIPIILRPSSSRTGEKTAAITFSCNRTGTFYYLVQDESVPDPSVEKVIGSGLSGSLKAGENASVSLTNLGDAKAKKTYVVFRTETGVNSVICPISIPAYVPGSFTVTYPTGNDSFFISLEDGSQTTVPAGGSFRFRVNLNSGYARTTDFAVHANNVVLAANNGVYTISDIRSNQTITVTGVESLPVIRAQTPTRTAENSAVFVFTSSRAGTYHYMILEDGASAPAIDLVARSGFSGSCAGGTPVSIGLTDLRGTGAKNIYILVRTASGVQSGMYRITIPPVTSPTPTPTPAAYSVTIQNGTGYSLNPTSGSQSPVAAGGSYSFTVTIFNGYTRGSNFAVLANNVPLSNWNGVYTISNIQANQTVTVTGVVYSQPVATPTPYTNVTAPSITTTLLPSASMGKAYSQQIAATGTGPITWTYTGSLPNGITLEASTGLLSGTPTAEGTFRFAIKASNSRGTATKQMTIVVAGTEYTVTSGNNTQWIQGSPKGVTFQSSGQGDFSVRVDGATVSDANLLRSADGKSVTISPEYLGTLSAGSHTLTLIYPDGSARARFNIRATDRSIPPSITAQPLSVTAREGESVTFTVTASGTNPLTYQWQVSTDGTGWTDAAGATESTFTTDSVTAAQNGWKYRCVITNSLGRAESAAAVLTIPVIAPEPSVPQHRSVLPGVLFTLLGLAAAGGLGFLGYRWYRKKRD